MATGFIQVLTQDGTKCCPCVQQSGCSCAGPPCVTKGRSITGSGTFIGFKEYVASVPPNFYRVKDLSGGAAAIASIDGQGCTNPSGCWQSWQYSGSLQYDKLTGALTTSAQLVQSGNCAAGGTIYPNECNAGDFNNVNGVSFNYPDIYYTLVHQFGPDNGGCRTSASGFIGGAPGGPAGYPSCMAVLSQQDTVSDAMFRAMGPNPTWVAQNGGDPLSNSSFTNVWSGKPFSFRQGQVQVTIPYPTVNHTYQVNIYLSQRGYQQTTQQFYPVGAIQSVIACSVAGPIATPWISIPVTAQFENFASSCLVIDITG